MSASRPRAGDRIGRGLLFPLRRVGEDFESGTGDTLLASNVKLAVLTDGATEDGAINGEYPWRLEFGSALKRQRHANIRDVVSDMAVIDTARAVARWEPRATVLTDQSYLEVPTGRREKRLRVVFQQEDDVQGGGVANEPVQIDSEVTV